ncbi:MAG: PAS domain-containing sensor histidine kinase [Ignavibacteriales bacterium]|nr:PAS domain-containing sensor histidine kinase [Ignavibacteriales bacterium]
MKRSKKQPELTNIEQVINKIELKNKKTAVENIEDVQKLVHLVYVHQIELEHQNQELRITQEELEVSRHKYVNLFDFSPIPYFTLNIDGIIKEVNLSAGKMFGVERKKLVGNRFISYVQLNERDIFNSFIKTVFNSPEKHSSQIKLVNKGKQILHVLMEGLKFDESSETDQKCQVAIIDLTEYKKIEDSLNKTNEELKTINDTKDKFFSIIAHDLRSPLQSLLSSSELLAKEIESLSGEEIQFFSKGLNENLNNLYTLLENLLNWSMMQRDKIEYNPVNLNLNGIVNNVIGISNPTALKKNIFISNSVEPGIFVYADSNMLRSVVQNLITNAVKFTRALGRIIITSVKNGDFIEVSIQDNGIGIESEKIAKLFNFNTLNTSSGTASESGTGLGLLLSKEFIERNGGKIWVESELGKGSKFNFTLRKAIS